MSAVWLLGAETAALRGTHGRFLISGIAEPPSAVTIGSMTEYAMPLISLDCVRNE